jgi:hypothetical protein
MATSGHQPRAPWPDGVPAPLRRSFMTGETTRYRPSSPHPNDHLDALRWFGGGPEGGAVEAQRPGPSFPMPGSGREVRHRADDHLEHGGLRPGVRVGGDLLHRGPLTGFAVAPRHRG